MPKVHNRKRLRVNNIHATVFCLSDVLLLNMPSDRHNEHFSLSMVLENASHSLHCLIPVHEWHHAVRQNQGVSIGVAFVYGFLNELNQLFSVVATVHAGLDVLHSQDSHESFDH